MFGFAGSFLPPAEMRCGFIAVGLSSESVVWREWFVALRRPSRWCPQGFDCVARHHG